MVALARLISYLRADIAEWQTARLAELTFTHREVAFIALILIVGLSIGATMLRSMPWSRPPGRREVALPAILQWSGRSRWSPLRHAAFVLFLVGIPFFAIALADPYATLTRRDVSFPGRRIAVMIDASSSMLAQFPTTSLNAARLTGAPPSAFFTTVAAAEVFVRQRMSGKYRDLIGLVEFGDEAYVVTPFTSDYDNILLSLSLIGDWSEFVRFPDQGTTIAKALEQGVQLFRAFDFLNASGNLMILFTDGQDRQVTLNGVPVSDILAEARATKIPVYMIRTGYNKALGDIVPDAIWKPAVEATGGRFYAASDEKTILRAVREIDQLSEGSVAVKQYGTEEPKFAGFALVAVALWATAAALTLATPYFQTFP